MTHLMFEIHLLLGCEAVCWITSYSEQGNSRLWGFTNTPFFFLNRNLSGIPRSRNNTGTDNLGAELIAFLNKSG